MNGAWVPHDTRDQIVDYVNHWTKHAELPARRLLGWLGLGTSKFHDWKHRYGQGGTGGSKTGRSKPSSTTTIVIRSKATAG